MSDEHAMAAWRLAPEEQWRLLAALEGTADAPRKKGRAAENREPGVSE